MTSRQKKMINWDVIFEGYKVRDKYFDKYDGIHTEISQAIRFDESIDLSTTYLRKMEMTRDMIIKAEEKFPISGQGYTHGKLLDSTECSILIDTGASKSYMSKSYYMWCKSLHALPKFAATTQKSSSRKWTMCSSIICNSHKSWYIQT